MIEWWESLGTIGRVFACVAIPSTVILFLQTLLMLIGIGNDSPDGDGGSADAPESDIDAQDGIFGDGDPDADVDGNADVVGGLHWLTFRGIIAFLALFGWVGVLCIRSEVNPILSALLAFASGVTGMILIALLFRVIYSLQSDGTENIRHAVGMTGTVYLRIPPTRSGNGKVNLLLDGKLVEKDAVTDDETQIAYGEQVLVVGISGGNTLIVRKKA